MKGGGLNVCKVGKSGSKTVNYGTYDVRKDLNLSIRYYDTDITLDLNGGFIPGNVTFDLGNEDMDP